ncbi:hypothetical protein [Petrachloros mirabilis]
MVTRLFILVALLIGIVLTVSCSSAVVQPTAASQPTTAPVQPTAAPQSTITPVQPTATTQPTATPVQATSTAQPTKASTTPTSPASTGGQQKLNLDDYMPAGAGRDLLLQNCTGCHSFVPIITGQRTRTRWESIRVAHKDAVKALDDKDYGAIYDYLEENFNDTKPEPKLPEWFVQSQTGTGE